MQHKPDFATLSEAAMENQPVLFLFGDLHTEVHVAGMDGHFAWSTKYKPLRGAKGGTRG